MGRTNTVEVELGQCMANEVNEEQQFPVYPLAENTVCDSNNEN